MFCEKRRNKNCTISLYFAKGYTLQGMKVILFPTNYSTENTKKYDQTLQLFDLPVVYREDSCLVELATKAFNHFTVIA